MVLCHSEVLVFRTAIHALNTRKFSNSVTSENRCHCCYGRRGVSRLSSHRTAELSGAGLLLHTG